MKFRSSLFKGLRVKGGALSPSADGEILQTAFLFANFFFGLFASKEKVGERLLHTISRRLLHRCLRIATRASWVLRALPCTRHLLKKVDENFCGWVCANKVCSRSHRPSASRLSNKNTAVPIDASIMGTAAFFFARPQVGWRWEKRLV